MRKLTLAMALVFSLAATSSFAQADKDKGMKCTPGKSCGKKTTKETSTKTVKKTEEVKKAA
ncbi:hypothetical protein [Mucilaginibacter agri]|uniref:Uncharacterized protein n=1 Tax=Mucilaginibacter agri TaxID=2695265 RepID=A0A966DU49_9SPHI|nr:hypothetical protein [Mucilaginibacter agri]NCD69324.1 hypothetical protein [Mucilaginibacter agri]